MTTTPIPRPGPPQPSLDVPSVAECLVRIEAARARRRGPSTWHSHAREQRAAVVLHALLRAAYEHDLVLADFDAATDLPATVYDTVVMAERVDAAR